MEINKNETLNTTVQKSGNPKMLRLAIAAIVGAIVVFIVLPLIYKMLTG